MNSKNINHNVLALTLSLCLGVIGFSTLSAQAADPPKGTDAQQKGVEKKPPTNVEMKQPFYCDWNFPGTVFDPTECDQLRANGVIIKNKKLVAIPGKMLNWKLVSKTDAKAVLDGIPIVMIRRSDRSIVAETRTAKDGSFQLTIPSNLSGDFGISSPRPEARYFEYCYLPPDVNVLTPMCEDDPPLYVPRVKPKRVEEDMEKDVKKVIRKGGPTKPTMSRTYCERKCGGQFTACWREDGILVCYYP